MLRLILATIIVSAAVSEAAPKIVLQGFKGKTAALAKLQVKKKLCSQYRCVTPKKGKIISVDAIVYGEVVRGKLDLSVYTEETGPDVREQFVLSKKGRLKGSQILAAAAAVDEAVKVATAE